MREIELIDTFSQNAVIKVIGIGGGGNNAVSHMADSHIDGVEFICANTDAQALRRLNFGTIIQLGVELTKGLGAGSNPNVGKQAAEENKDRIEEVLKGADMIFLTAGMGGGTGTGGIPVVAEIAKNMGILTVAVVTKPFAFEGNRKCMIAEQGIAELEKYVDSLIIIPNQKLLPVLGNKVSLIDAFKAANNVLLDAVRGITDLIVHPGMVNVDFADVRTVMSGMGAAIMGIGSASGDNRAKEAAEKAIACPLLEDINLQGARGILVNVSAADIGIAEYNEIGAIVHAFAAEDAVVKVGMAVDPDLQDEIKVTVVATGMSSSHRSANQKIGMDAVQNLATGQMNYDSLEKPTVLRQKNQSANEGRTAARFGAQPKKDGNLDYLDIPSFLRRQAD